MAVVLKRGGIVIGVDVGATRIRTALYDPRRGEIVSRVSFETPRVGGRGAVAERILEVLRREFGDRLREVGAVGVGTIGPLDISSGVVVDTPNLPIRTFDIAKPLMDELGKPVLVANDCVAAAWGEYVFGIGGRLANLVYVTISTGIGGGAVVDGELLLGKKGNAHEIGHLVVDAGGRMECGCGGRGHWEAYGGGANIPKFASALIEEYLGLGVPGVRESGLYRAYEAGEITPELVYEGARRGDPTALRIVSEINRYHAAGFESVINAYDPEAVTLGGSIALRNPELVVEPVRRHVLASRGLLTKPPEVLLTPLGEDASLLGAIALVVETPGKLLKALRYLSA